MISFDFETMLIRQGLPAPPPVCLSLCREGCHPEIVPSSNAWSYMSEALEYLLDSCQLLVGFNTAFDLGVWLQWFPQHTLRIFEALEEGRVHCLQIAERLLEISTGAPPKYDNLASIASRYGVAKLNKAESPRTRYGPLLGEELSCYPQEHIDYSLKDAEVTVLTYLRQRSRSKKYVTDAAIAAETRAAAWLHLSSCAGIRSNVSNIETLYRNARSAVARLSSNAISHGFIRANGSKDTKAIKKAVLEAYAGKPPLTKTGLELSKEGKPWELKHVATNKTALVDSADPLLEEFAEFGEWSAVLNKDVKMLLGGVEKPISTRYGLANALRTTSSNPNIQNFRRVPGVRECIVPREGKCFGQIDISGFELGSLAQVIYWKTGGSVMRDMINGGKDLHTAAAAVLLEVSYEKALKLREEEDESLLDARQLCKIANFGYPGYMAAKTLIAFARQQDVKMELRTAERLKTNWSRTFPDAQGFLQWLKGCRNSRGSFDFEIPASEGVWRRNCTLPACANGHFQGPAAVAAKRIGWELTKESWCEPRSPLYAIPIVMFIHDEFFFEIPVGDQHFVMQRVKQVLESELREIFPDVKLSAEPSAMSVWSKKAKPIYRKGELQIWHP